MLGEDGQRTKHLAHNGRPTRVADGAGSYERSDNICLLGETTTTAGVSRDEIRDKKCCPPLHLAGTQTHIPASSPRAHAPRVALTAEDRDGDGLFLLDGLRVGEAGVADVVVTGILWEHVGEVEIAVEGLGHPAALRQLLEV